MNTLSERKNFDDDNDNNDGDGDGDDDDGDNCLFTIQLRNEKDIKEVIPF